MLLVFQVINQLTETLFPYLNLCYVLSKVGLITSNIPIQSVIKPLLHLEQLQSKVDRKRSWSLQDIRPIERANTGTW